jgi:hypothetical protein
LREQEKKKMDKDFINDEEEESGAEGGEEDGDGEAETGEGAKEARVLRRRQLEDSDDEVARRV